MLASVLPESLDMDVIPAGISGVDQARLNEVFGQLDDKINRLAQRIEAHRTYQSPHEDQKSRDSRKCQLICKDMHGEAKLRCLKQCVRPVVKLENMEVLRPEFPIDVQRLDQDMHLRQNFERHQRAVETIVATDAEASLIADLYAMPLATAALPEESWARAMEIIQKKEFAPQRDSLVRNWKLRTESYSADAQEELARKIIRHDNENIIMNAARKWH